jgi:hypothetical protein
MMATMKISEFLAVTLCSLVDRLPPPTEFHGITANKIVVCRFSFYFVFYVLHPLM